MKLLGALLMVTCAALAQTPDLKSASRYPKMVQKQVTGWIERAAEKMAELTSAVHDAFAYCDRLTDADAMKRSRSLAKSETSSARYGSTPHTIWSTTAIWWSTCG
ncbi:MAG: hypothetical protein M3Y72_21880 [Acidobacteriota bacterium]|nr:hypothetical protein [Acidobacteriota bacterium]